MATILSTKKYKSYKGITKRIEKDLDKSLKELMFETEIELMPMMKKQIDMFYAYAKRNNERYENTGEFGESLTFGKIEKYGKGYRFRIFFDPAGIKTIVQPSFVNKSGYDSPNRKMGRTSGFWGIHAEFENLNDLFRVLDDLGWWFPTRTRADQGDRPPAETMATGMLFIKSKQYENVVKTFMETQGWDIFKE